MDSQQIYETFGIMMLESFEKFLLKIEKSDIGAMDCTFMKKLDDINKTVEKILEKRNSSPETVQVAKKASCESIPPKITKFSSPVDKKRKTTDGHHSDKSDDIFERMKNIISRDIDGSDDSDCEMKCLPVSSDELFKTDYPPECFNSEKQKEIAVSYSPACFNSEEKKENAVSCQDVSSSLNKSTIICIEDDPYIRRFNPDKATESNGDADQNYQYIVKVIEDVYRCEICLINNLPKNNVSTHVNGRQHKNSLSKRVGTEVKPKEADETLKLIQKKDLFAPLSLPIIPMYECTLCKTEITCRENALQHIMGRQHNRKLENARLLNV